MADLVETELVISLMSHYELTKEQCDLEVSDKCLEEISSCCCKRWRSLPPHLEMKSIVVDDLDHSLGTETEKRQKLFSRWHLEKGSAATYRSLIGALLEINCRQDAESVCRILKKFVLKQEHVEPPPSTSSDCPVTIGGKPLDEDTLLDLTYQLQRNLNDIQECYASYVSAVHNRVKGVSVEDLSIYLLSLTALESEGEQQCKLLSSVSAEIEEAETIFDIFKLLSSKWASFLNYDIFESILRKYGIKKDCEDLNYPLHLKRYLEKHKISEFLSINPKLEEYIGTSDKLYLKFNTDLHCRLAKVYDLRTSLAHILGIMPSALRLIGIKSGCIAVTFLIPPLVADVILSNGLSIKQREELCELSYKSLHCKDFNFKIGEDTQVTGTIGDDTSISRPVLCHSLSLDSGRMKQLSLDQKLEDLRTEFNGKIKDLTDMMEMTTEKLKLEKECKEEKERAMMSSVTEVGSPEEREKAQRSQSIQCSSDGSEQCGTKLFAHGPVLCNTDHSLSLDSGRMKQLSLDQKLEDLRTEFNGKIKDLTDMLDEKTNKLMEMTTEKLKLEKECKEKKERVGELKKKLGNKIEALQHEVDVLKARIQMAVNNNESLETQIRELQEKKSKPDSNTTQNTGESHEQLIQKLYAAIQGVVVEQSGSQSTPSQEELERGSTKLLSKDSKFHSGD